MVNYNGEWFTPLDNGLWRDNKTGAIGRLKKGRGAGWYIDSDDQTPMGKREQRIKGKHINNSFLEDKEIIESLNNAQKQMSKAKVEPEWKKAEKNLENWQKIYDLRKNDKLWWEIYDNPKEEKEFSDLDSKHIQGRIAKARMIDKENESK